jgi:hypothetical protein
VTERDFPSRYFGAGGYLEVKPIGTGSSEEAATASGSLSKNARIAGLLYLAVVAIAPFRLMYVPGALFVHGNAAATVHNIAAHESLFRLGIFSELLTGVATLFAVLALYRLFEGVNQTQAVLMVVLGALMQVPIFFINALNDVAVLLLARGTDFLSAFGGPQRDALAMLFLSLHGYGIAANEIFWGLWLLPFGLLAFKSGFLPRILGIWLIVNGFAYLAQSVSGFLFPQYEDAISTISLPLQLGEVAMMLWLLIVGAKKRPTLARP